MAVFVVKVFLSLVKPEPIMLLILPIILSRISHIFTYYSLFIPMLSPIIQLINDCILV